MNEIKITCTAIRMPSNKITTRNDTQNADNFWGHQVSEFVLLAMKTDIISPDNYLAIS